MRRRPVNTRIDTPTSGAPALAKAPVTVVIPFYNRSACAQRLLESVTRQTRRPEAVLFVDNGSDQGEIDSLREIIHSFSSSLTIEYLRTTIHGNANVARSLGMHSAKTRYVAFLDSDDWWEPRHLEVSLDVLRENDRSGVYSGSIIRSRVTHVSRSVDVNILPTPFHLLFSGNDWSAQTSTYVIDMQKIGTIDWDQRLRRHQDYDFFLEIAYNSRGWAFNPLATGNLDRNNRGQGRNFDFKSMIRFLKKWRSCFPAPCLSVYLLLQMDACIISRAPDRYYKYYRSLYLSVSRSASSAIKTSKPLRAARIQLIEASKRLGVYMLLKKARRKA